jgi:hypothetical protein
MGEVGLRHQDSNLTGSALLGVVAPLAVAGASYGLWFVSDRLLYVGPLDRASFGWMVVVPVWAAAPLAAGFVWLRLSSAGRSLAATVCGLVVGGAATVLFWLAVRSPDCQFGPVRPLQDWLVPAVAVGVLIGGGFAVGGLVATRIIATGRPWLALLGGAIIQLGIGATATVFVYAMMLGGVCQRPPV